MFDQITTRRRSFRETAFIVATLVVFVMLFAGFPLALLDLESTSVAARTEAAARRQALVAKVQAPVEHELALLDVCRAALAESAQASLKTQR